MLHICCTLINSSTLKTSSISTNLWGPGIFKTLQETSYIQLGVQINLSFMIQSSTKQRSTWVQYFRTKTLQVRSDSTENKLNPIQFLIYYNVQFAIIILLCNNEMFKLKINNSKPEDWSRIPLIIHNQMCYYEYMIPDVRQNLSVWDFLSSMAFDDFSKFHDFPWLFQKIIFFQVFQTLWEPWNQGSCMCVCHWSIFPH